MNCSLCANSFFKINALVTHMKIVHQCNNNSTFTCGQLNCGRRFSSLNSFRKHLRVHESKTETISHTENIYVENIIYQSEENEQCSLPPNSLNPIQDECSLEDAEEKSYQLFKTHLHDNGTLFLSKLYSESNIRRKDVQSVIDGIQELLNMPLNIFKDYLLSISYLKQSDKHHIQRYFDEFHSIFEHFDTEYRRLKYLEQIGLYIPPVELVVGQHMEKKTTQPVPSLKNYTCQYIPLTSVLKKFFELPGIFHDTLQYMENLKQSSCILNIIQTEYWKEKIACFDEKDIVFPLYIYFDDYESGNPLGSHAGIHKIGAVYYTVSCLNPQFQSRLENIFVAMLFHSSDLKDFGEKMIFSELVKELNYLKTNGIKLNLSDTNEQTQVYFCLALILGDNLALNTVLGFQESFNANSFCRFCKCSKSETQKLCYHSASNLRNELNYEADLITNNSSLTGIKFNPVFNGIEQFHITKNYSVDIAHDIFEGVGVLVMANLLHQFVLVDKFFDIETLNNKIRFFDFPADFNRPPVISVDNLKKKTIKMSASEMKSFIINAGLIFGSLIPINNKYWLLYILLRRILKIVLNEFVTPSKCNELGRLIYEHHSRFTELFRSLTPKFHFMTHYPFIMEKVGPLSKLSTLRFESKHRVSKLAGNVVCSRVNITKTLAIKHQLQLVSRLTSKEHLNNRFLFSYTKIKNKSLSTVSSLLSDVLNPINDEILHSFQHNISQIYKMVFDNRVLREKDVILIKDSDPPLLGQIYTMIINKLQGICIIYSVLDILRFNEHMFCFEVSPTNTIKYLFFTELHNKRAIPTMKRNNIIYVNVF